MAAQVKPLVLHFKDIDKSDVALVGGKGANLGEMTQAGFPVPTGFAVSVPSYDKFLIENSLDKRIYEILEACDVTNPAELEGASKSIQKLITQGRIPEEVAYEVIKSYKKLSGLFKQALVAVRSSATAEDLANASFAGQQASFLNVKGEANLLLKVKECWASLFTQRSIFYRVQNKIPHASVKIAVMVQKMVESEVSGVMFTLDPVTNARDRIVIEAVWGLGEMIVQGSVVPDKYVVQKETFSILSKEISDQGRELTRVNGETKEITVPAKLLGKQKITNEEIVELAHLADRLQKHYFFPQDAEWAKQNGKLYLVQTRPVTTANQRAKSKEKKDEKNFNETASVPILVGTPASPGMGTGYVRVLKSAKEIGKVKRGDIIVTEMTSPDFVPAMKLAAAIITDKGGQTSHAAIVSRELGIPCVVGTEEGTKVLKEGELLTVDGAKGAIYVGSRVVREKSQEAEVPKTSKSKTATKIYVNLAEPEKAREIAKLNVDGVGLLRAEFMIAEIGVHPKEAIKRHEQDKFIDKLALGISTFCREFYPRPVIYRATDFKTNEYRALAGGPAWEPVEPNPMLGYRGAFRYINSPEVFNLELVALKKVREKYSNLWLMIPFVRSPGELAKVRRMVAAEGFFDSSTFRFLMMVELPVNVILLPEFIKVGIDGVSIGSNDLTMLLEGTDRDNAEVAREFNERSEAVYWALERIIKVCHKAGITSSICGQAASTYDDLVENLVKWGITSISVSPDSVDRLRDVVHLAEEKL